MLVEDTDAQTMGAWADWPGLSGLQAALDKRGERELGLLTELSKVGALMHLCYGSGAVTRQRHWRGTCCLISSHARLMLVVVRPWTRAAWA